MEKPVKVAWVDLEVGWGEVSGNHQNGVNGVSQIDGNSVMVPACQCRLGEGRLKKGTMASTSTSIWEKAATPALSLKPDFTVSHHIALVPFELLIQCWSAERVSHQ